MYKKDGTYTETVGACVGVWVWVGGCVHVWGMGMYAYGKGLSHVLFCLQGSLLDFFFFEICAVSHDSHMHYVHWMYSTYSMSHYTEVAVSHDSHVMC